jgi:hypothetical protein
MRAVLMKSCLAMGVALAVLALPGAGSFTGTAPAFAGGKGGGGGGGGDHGGGGGGNHGNGGDHGNGGNHGTGGNHAKNTSSSSDDGQGDDSEDSSDTGGTSSDLGALNAAHASSKAFAHASPNSRVGKIKAYYVANEAALTAGADATAAQQTLNDNISNLLSESQYSGITADQINAALASADPTTALSDLGITGADATSLMNDYSSWQSADAAAQQDQQLAQDALDAAANKHPVSAETKAALDALLVGKITE